MRIISLLFSLLLGLTLTSSVNTVNAGENKSFRLEFGPWSEKADAGARTRVVELLLSNYIFGMCVEEQTSGKSNITEACPFVAINDKGEAVVDQAYAMRKLYHDSGMNIDGSPRRFYHRWLGID